MKICLYGSGSRKIDKIYTDKGYELGCKIAENGHSLVFGGGETGMMGAVLQGVLDKGGKSLGISPEWIDNFERLATNCSEFIYVDSMDERKNKFLENSDAFIIAPGGIGTLDEFFEIITLKKLKQHKKAIILFNINNYYDTLIEMIKEMVEKGFIGNDKEIFKITSDIDEIFKYLDEYNPDSYLTSQYI